MSRMADLYARVAAERRAVLERRMRRKPLTAKGAIDTMHDDGEAWLTDLGARRAGIGADDVGELTVLIAEDRVVENMTALARAGIPLAQTYVGAIGAGVGSALLIGVDVGRAELAARIYGVAQELELDAPSALAAIVELLEPLVAP